MPSAKRRSALHIGGVSAIPSAEQRSTLLCFSALRRLTSSRTGDAERGTPLRSAVLLSAASARRVQPPLAEPRSAIPLSVWSGLVDDPAMPNANFVLLCFLAARLLASHSQRTGDPERRTPLRSASRRRACSPRPASLTDRRSQARNPVSLCSTSQRRVDSSRLIDELVM
jgi:hypothetical protein